MSVRVDWSAIFGRRRRAVPALDPSTSAKPSAQLAEVNQWRIAGASVTGVSHQNAERPCGDSWSVVQTTNGFVLAIVSDGAGSASMGAFAAREICNVLVELTNELSALPTVPDAYLRDDSKPQTSWSDILVLIENRLEVARGHLLNHVSANEKRPDDYLATVVGVVAHRARGALCFHIGDGAVTVFDTLGRELLTSQPENGEYLNQTYFLIEEHWRAHFRVSDAACDQLGSIFLMTDGVTDLAYHREGRTLTPEPKFFAPLAEFLTKRTREAGDAGIAKMLDADRAKELVDDDKTLIWIKPFQNGEQVW